MFKDGGPETIESPKKQKQKKPVLDKPYTQTKFNNVANNFNNPHRESRKSI